MSEAAPFSRRASRWLVGLAATSFLVALGLSIFSDDLGAVPTAGADGYSRSALGHRALVGFLESYDIPVMLSRYASASRAGDSAVLLVAEPRLGSEEDRELLAEMVGHQHVVVVLPKRRGEEDPDKRAFIRESSLVSETEVDEVLDVIDLGGQVARPASASFPHNELGFAPSLPSPQLVVDADGFEPLVAGDEGMLIGLWTGYGGHRVLVVADPDLVANHGLADGENAALLLAALDRVRDDDAAVVVDETLHGHVSPPSLWRELASFPLSLASLSVILAMGALLWSAQGRFGRPLPAPRLLGPGKAFLVDNTAELIRYGGHHAHALERYLAATISEVARASHAPGHLGPRELRAWLVRAQKARKTSLDLDLLEQEVTTLVRDAKATPERVLAAADRLFRWRQEMTNGSLADRRAA